MSQHQKQNDIHWLTGQFSDRQRELSYRRSIESNVRSDARLALILASVIFAMFGITDYNLLGLTREYYLLLTMRITVVSSCLLVAFIIGQRGGYVKTAWLHALPLWIFAVGIILIVPLRPESLSSQVTSATIAIVAFYLLIPNLLTIAALASVFLSITFLIATVIYAGVDGEGVVRIGLLIAMANIVGYASLRRLERLQRKQYALLNDEQQQNHELVQEIARRKSLEAQLRMVAEHDALTGVDSRSHFMKRAEALLQRSRLEQAPFCLFMIDVDHFKKINDTWGHTRGDRILAKIADVCQHALRPTDIIGRFGGEEFVVGLPNTAPADAKAVAERLKQQVEQLSLEAPLNSVQLSVTIGVAVATAEDDLDALITRADDKLYKGKRAGRSRVVTE